MRTLLMIAILFIINSHLSAQNIVAKIDMKGVKVENLCNQDEYYMLMNGFDNQSAARCPLEMKDFYDRLLKEVPFIENNPKFKGKGVIDISINCKGEVVLIKSNFKDEELNQQLIAFVNSLGNWQAGILNKKPVDSQRLLTMEIKKGEVLLNEYFWK